MAPPPAPPTDRQWGFFQEEINKPSAPGVADIANISFQNQLYSNLDKYRSTIEPQAHSTYFPSADNNINKGTYSGSIVGNVPIFAPSMLTPFGAFDAVQSARKANDEAAAKADADFFALYGKAPETTRKAVQAELQNGYMDWLAGWKQVGQQRYGSRWTQQLRSDPQFLKEEQSWNTIAQYNTQLVDQVAQYEALKKTGDWVASPETEQYKNAVLTGVDGLAIPGNPEAGRLSQNMLKFTVSYDLDKAANQAVDKVIQDTYESYPGTTANGIYDILVTTKTTETGKSKLDDMADSLYNTRYQGSDFITREMVYKALEDRLGKKVERSVQTKTNQFSDSGGASDVYSDADVEEDAQLNVTVNAKEGGTDRVANVTGYDGYTFKRPIKTVTAQGETMYDFGTGQMVQSQGSEEIVWGEARNMRVNANGSIIPDDQIINGQYVGSTDTYTFQPMVIGKYVVPEKLDANGKVISPEKEVTVAKPASELKNAITKTDKTGKQISGIPVETMNQKAQARNQNKVANAPTPKPAVSQPASVPDNIPSGTRAEWKTAGWSDAQIDQGVAEGKIKLK